MADDLSTHKDLNTKENYNGIECDGTYDGADWYWLGLGRGCRAEGYRNHPGREVSQADPEGVDQEVQAEGQRSGTLG